jgi:nucleoside-diphosphate-sugar epimerase
VQGHFPGTEIDRVERDRLMPVRGTLSVEKARRLLGYEPAHPLELGIEKYVAWYRERVPSPAIS